MMVRHTILLADDNPKDVELILTFLAEHNLEHEVVVSRDGVEALDYLYCRGHYNLRPPGNPMVILLDLKMPKLGGLEVLRAIKSDEQLRVIPVVMLTSSREECDLAESYQLGANAYVVKPVSFELFRQALRQTATFWGTVNEPPPRA
jgi:CheY-like chemotaxis protein